MTVDVAIQLLLALIDRSAAISQLIQSAKAAGQTTLSDDQWVQVLTADNTARNALFNALASQQQKTQKV